MACIRAIVMIAHQVIICLISQPKHMLWVLKRTIAMRGFFKTPDNRLNLMNKKIFIILSSKIVFIWTMTYTVGKYDTPQ